MKDIIFKKIDSALLVADPREIAARLSLPIGQRTEGQGACEEKLRKSLSAAYAAREVGLVVEGSFVSLGDTRVESTDLAHTLRGCSGAVLLALTLGAGVDRLLLRLSSLSAYDAFLTDGIADALAEALADFAEAEVCAGREHTNRFSPGYGNLALSVGADILSALDCERLLGIKLLESGLMFPKKSVTAIIGIK